MIGVEVFGGISGRPARRQGDAARASIAENTKLWDGTLAPFREPRLAARAEMCASVLAEHECAVFVDPNPCASFAFSGPGCGRVFGTGLCDHDRPVTAYVPEVCSFEVAEPNWTYLGVPQPDPVTFTVPPLEAPHMFPRPDHGYQLKREHRDYVVTFVNIYGEEGRASLPSPSAQDADADAPATITLPDAPADAGWALRSMRIYRLQTGNMDGEFKVDAPFLFVDEVPLTTRTYVDDVPVDELGEELHRFRADPPPTNLEGIVALDNGALAGFSGNNLYFSEPFHYNVWPCYQTLEDCIRALVPIGGQLYVLTDGRPYLVDVTQVREEPNDCCYPIAHIKEPLPLISDARGAVATFNGVVYPSTTGLVRLTGPSATIVTHQDFDRDDWQDLHPHTFKGANLDGKYYGWGAKGGFVFDYTDGVYADGDVGVNSRAFTVSLLPNSAFTTRKGVMLLGFMDEIRVWDDGAAWMKYRWRSRLHDLDSNIAWGAARLKFESGSCPDFREHPVTLRFLDGCDNLLFHRSVSTDKPFRLPLSLFRHTVQVEVEGTSEVAGVYLAPSIRDLVSTSRT